jgi:hypothetical protein
MPLRARRLLQSSTSNINASPRTTQLSRTWRDRFLLALCIGALLLLTSLPQLYGSLSSPTDRRFMGIVLDVPDTAQYFSWLRAHQHALIVSNLMTPEPNQPAFFNLLWLCLGRLASWTGISFAFAFQLLRLVVGVAFGYTLFWLYGLLAEDRREQWLATILVLVGGGVGWIWVIEKYLTRRADLLYPLDVQVAEPNAFLSLIGYPHFLLAAALVLAILGLFIVGVQTARMAAYGLAGLIGLTLGLQHAYDLITVYGVLGGFVLLLWWNRQQFPRREAAGLILIGLLSSPPAAYFTYLTSHDPIWRQVLAQFGNAGVYTPNPLHLLIIFGPQLPLALATLPGLLRRQRDADLLLLAWVVVGFGLLYIPTDFQIHMLNPYQVPLAILAVRAARRIAGSPGKATWLRKAAPALLLAIAIPVNLYLFTWRFVDLRRHQAPYYLHQDEVAAIEWLNQQRGDGVVLSDETLGQYVPALAGKRTVLAHWAQTIDYYTKRAQIARFFDSATPQPERAALLERYHVSYVLVGEDELRAGAQSILTTPELEKTFETPAAVVYRVR